jgi:hypothetical protein
VLEAKLAYYESHEHIFCVLFVRQDRVEATQYSRMSRAPWQEKVLRDPEQPLSIPEIGEIGALGALYPHTPLDPQRP